MTGTDLAGLRIMVVEDELMIALLVADTLADQAGVVVGPFTRVQPALAVARCEMLDAAVLDVNIAGDTTYPVADVLEARGVPFLFLSGYGEHAIPRDRPHWRVCGKPFRPVQLIGMLRDRITLA